MTEEGKKIRLIALTISILLSAHLSFAQQPSSLTTTDTITVAADDNRNDSIDDQTTQDPDLFTHFTSDQIVIGDTLYIITTACAPICSSIVKMFNNRNEEYLGTLSSPFPHAVFPEAYIENDLLLWRDNTPEFDNVD